MTRQTWAITPMKLDEKPTVLQSSTGRVPEILRGGSGRAIPKEMVSEEGRWAEKNKRQHEEGARAWSKLQASIRLGDEGDAGRDQGSIL